MPLLPVVRHMILCEDWEREDGVSLRVNVRGVLTSIHSLDFPAFPLSLPEVCVLVFLTDCRGLAEIALTCTDEDSGKLIYNSEPFNVELGDDPLSIIIMPFRIREMRFPQAGIYRFELWYNSMLVAEQPLRLR